MAALAALLVAACAVSVPSGDARPGSTAASSTLEIRTGDGTDRRFVPAASTVSAGRAVRVVFHNRSSEAHNLSFTGALEHIRTRTIMEPGTSETLSFVAPGPGAYPFVCTVHVGMAGQLIVAAEGLRG
jgi:plastocyanin